MVAQRIAFVGGNFDQNLVNKRETLYEVKLSVLPYFNSSISHNKIDYNTKRDNALVKVQI